MSDATRNATPTDGILTRRALAWLIDAALLAVALAVLHAVIVVLGVLTLGLGWLLLGALPAIPFLYAVLFLAGARAATPGQALLGVQAIHAETRRRPSLAEAVVAILVFYLSLALPLLLLVPLLNRSRRTLHDLASGLVFVRTRALTLPAQGWNMRQPNT